MYRKSTKEESGRMDAISKGGVADGGQKRQSNRRAKMADESSDIVSDTILGAEA